MARYIDAEALISELSASCMPIDDREISGLFDCDESIRDIIEAVPAADVRPERYSHWHEYLICVFMGRFSKDGEPIYQDRKTFMCVKCGRGSAIKEKFCPNCGAKMGGKSDDWISTVDQLPPENQVVNTKIDDENGIRNEQKLIYSNNRWWFPDKSMYVYYSPTHWKYSEEE